MPISIKDVAEKAGVSPSTVSRVLANNPRISPQTSERVRMVLKEMNYHPNEIARSLVRQRSRTLGLILPNAIDQFFLNPFFPEVLRGISQSARKLGYDLFLSTASQGLNDVERLDQMVQSKRVDGVILLTVKLDDPLLKHVQDTHVPAVLIGRSPGQSMVASINNDNKKAGYDATMHLLRLGHQRIGFIGGSPELILTIDRLAGYAQALSDGNVRFDPQLVTSEEFLEEGGYTGMMKLLALPTRPSAIIASDDVLAFGAMRAAGELGYHIPQDFAIVGFNDIPLAKIANPPLTTMNVHIFELGEGATTMLIDQIANRPGRSTESQIVPHDLIIRRSCGAWNPTNNLLSHLPQ